MKAPGATRLLAAAVLCVLALGLAWDSSVGSVGQVTPGIVLTTTYVGFDGDLTVGSQYYAGTYLPGDPLRAARGFQSDVRVVLVPAAVVLAWAARHRTDRSRAATRAVVGALVAIIALALGRGMVQGALVAAAAVALATPVAWPAASASPAWVHGLRAARRATGATGPA